MSLRFLIAGWKPAGHTGGTPWYLFSAKSALSYKLAAARFWRDSTHRFAVNPTQIGAGMNRAFSAGGLALHESSPRRAAYERRALGAKQIRRLCSGLAVWRKTSDYS